MNINSPLTELTPVLSLKDKIGLLPADQKHLILTRGVHRSNPTYKDVAPIFRANNISLDSADMLRDEDVDKRWLDWYKEGVDMRFVHNLKLSQHDMNILMYPAWNNTHSIEKGHPISERKQVLSEFPKFKKDFWNYSIYHTSKALGEITKRLEKVYGIAAVLFTGSGRAGLSLPFGKYLFGDQGSDVDMFILADRPNEAKQAIQAEYVNRFGRERETALPQRELPGIFLDMATSSDDDAGAFLMKDQVNIPKTANTKEAFDFVRAHDLRFLQDKKIKPYRLVRRDIKTYVAPRVMQIAHGLPIFMSEQPVEINNELDLMSVVGQMRKVNFSKRRTSTLPASQYISLLQEHAQNTARDWYSSNGPDISFLSDE